ncbi:MAG TPA: ribosomal L7Ae/L30e/S12e/Gadd45 family protein [Clostridia bacterium]|nr:MAG: putative ribosomal protein YlxQ [Firmicutes bacterium ADurb.Bin248]HOG01736.1 ribosomal L7Ae/L30e/S12e/Gadd45 family protein [Clostridia bacterium]HOS17836.1 ribosomal L7Ae/L30e/S12e/Gadd45 family protein [Clostridia bacterium]HPK16565.1 ribosomal L7Ae/L30e/S12e/Gadd45 family protein [Clostridia bacterium]
MADGKKLRGALGLAMKAGKCAAGDFACEKLIKGSGARLALLDANASDNTKQRYRGMCARAGIPLLEVEDLGGAIGKPGRMIAAVTDEGFAKLILSAHRENDTGQNDTGVE